MTPEESRAVHPSNWKQLDATFVHLQDQAQAAHEVAADIYSIDLYDPTVIRTIGLVANTILAHGQMAEPDNDRVADAFYCAATAWVDIATRQQARVPR